MPSIYLHLNGEQQGPYTEEQIRKALSEGQITSEVLAWREGLAEWQPLSAVSGLVPMVAPPPFPPQPTQVTATKSESIFLYIPIARLVFMSLISLGIYEAYWIYRNWRYLKERDTLKIRPFWRGIFGVFFIYSILKEIKNDRLANSLAPATFSAGGLATGWIILVLLGNLTSRAPDPMVNLVGIIISAPSFLFLVPAQIYINRVNESLPLRPSYYKWSIGHIVIIVIGILAIIGIISSFCVKN